MVNAESKRAAADVSRAYLSGGNIQPDITWRTARLSLSDSWPFTNIMCSVQAMLLKAKEFLNTDNALRIFPAPVIQTRVIADAGVTEKQLRQNKKFL